MSLPFLSAEHIEAFILVFLRVSAIIVTIPVISEKNIPFQIKAALSLLISLIIFPLVLPKIPQPANYRFCREMHICGNPDSRRDDWLSNGTISCQCH
jgi:flagellar biosynthesis protein FliR